MTLTTERPQRGDLGVTRRAAVGTPAPSPAPRPTPSVHLVLPDVYRVTDDEAVIGYIQIAGPVFVGLRGTVYNTSVEVGQHLDLERALHHLVEQCRDSA